jgi:hypothetical protein
MGLDNAKQVVVNNSHHANWLGLLGIIFVCCKIFEVQPIAGWSWWWVTAPFWGPLALVFGILGLVALCFLAFTLFVGFIEWIQNR